jgi:hypothetical protein
MHWFACWGAWWGRFTGRGIGRRRPAGRWFLGRTRLIWTAQFCFGVKPTAWITSIVDLVISRRSGWCGRARVLVEAELYD